MQATLVACLALLAFDYLWLKFNSQRFNRLVRAVQHSDMRINYTGAVLSYACLLLVLIAVSFPLAKRMERTMKSPGHVDRLKIALYAGGIIGFASYGVMHMTNLAIFRDYNMWIGGMDMIWGGVVSTLCVWVYLTMRR